MKKVTTHLIVKIGNETEHFYGDDLVTITHQTEGQILYIEERKTGKSLGSFNKWDYVRDMESNKPPQNPYDDGIEFKGQSRVQSYINLDVNASTNYVPLEKE